MINANGSSPLEFALAKGLFPVLDVVESWVPERDPLKLDSGVGQTEGWVAPSEDMVLLLNFLHEKWRVGEPYTYYQFERRLKQHPFAAHMERGVVIYACRYFFLHEVFDQEFWDQLCMRGECPIEADLITSTNCW